MGKRVPLPDGATLDDCPWWQKLAEESRENASTREPDLYPPQHIPEYSHRLVDQISGCSKCYPFETITKIEMHHESACSTCKHLKQWKDKCIFWKSCWRSMNDEKGLWQAIESIGGSVETGEGPKRLLQHMKNHLAQCLECRMIKRLQGKCQWRRGVVGFEVQAQIEMAVTEEDPVNEWPWRNHTCTPLGMMFRMMDLGKRVEWRSQRSSKPDLILFGGVEEGSDDGDNDGDDGCEERLTLGSLPEREHLVLPPPDF